MSQSRRPKTARKPKPAVVRGDEQSEWRFAEVESLGAMPRCEKTGVNVDLHLVAYRDPDTNEFTARILGSDYRHLVRRWITLSVPVAILGTVSIRQLEKLRKIPLGTRAARQLREWFGRDSEDAWKKKPRSTEMRAMQEPLDLPVAGDQEAFRLF